MKKLLPAFRVLSYCYARGLVLKSGLAKCAGIIFTVINDSCTTLCLCGEKGL